MYNMYFACELYVLYFKVSTVVFMSVLLQVIAFVVFYFQLCLTLFVFHFSMALPSSIQLRFFCFSSFSRFPFPHQAQPFSPYARPEHTIYTRVFLIRILCPCFLPVFFFCFFSTLPSFSAPKQRKLHKLCVYEQKVTKERLYYNDECKSIGLQKIRLVISFSPWFFALLFFFLFATP